MQRLVNDVERRTADNVIKAVVCNACYMADMTAAFLKAQGFRPRKKAARCSVGLVEDSPEVRRVNAFLMNLAAALRIALWERAGFRRALPADLPSSSEAFRNVVPPEVAGTAGDAPVIPELYTKVFRTWLEQFSRSSQAALSTDVLLAVKGVSEDKLLDALADLVWENRHLANAKEQ